MWYHRNAQFSAAAESFRGAIKSNPNFVPAYNNLGIVYEKMNKRPEAIKLFEKALSIDPNNAEVRRNLERVRSQYKG
jgi:tetratricopeptide (TPR) repeat protein